MAVGTLTAEELAAEKRVLKTWIACAKDGNPLALHFLREELQEGIKVLEPATVIRFCEILLESKV